MSIIAKGAKVFVNADGPIKLFDGGQPNTSNIWDLPNGEGNVKDYYGALSQKQNDLSFQPGSIVGTATGTTKVYNGSLYYQILISGAVDERTSHGLGAGTYKKIDWFGFASSAEITDVEDNALEKYNKRTDGATKTAVASANAKGNSSVSLPVTGAGSGSGTPTTNKTLIFGGLGLAVLGFCIWFFGFRK